MNSSAGVDRLTPQEWERLEDIAGRFEDAWRTSDQHGTIVELDEYLPAAQDTLRAPVLTELIKTDLEMRWRRNMPIQLERYTERYPELGGPAKLSPQVIYEEYRVRQMHGDRPALASYQTRFPTQYPDLQRLIAEQPVGTVLASQAPIPNVTTAASRMGKPRKTKAAPASDKPPAGVFGSSQMLPVGGGYKLIKKLGAGQFGEVWQAEAPGGVAAAMKLIHRNIDEVEGQRELQSLELIKRLGHPFLLQTHAFWALEDRLVIAMELADGSLRDRLRECRKEGLKGIPAGELLKYIREAADGLDYLHREKVTHRDIKPENILLLKGHAKVADFGLARWQESTRIVMSASIAGTPIYMAPEIWQGKVSERSDLYSLAVTYAELRLDRTPFPGRQLVEIMRDHLEGKPDLQPLEDPEQEVLFKAMAKDPNERYRNCREFAQQLTKSLVRVYGHTDPELEGLVLGDSIEEVNLPSQYGPGAGGDEHGAHSQETAPGSLGQTHALQQGQSGWRTIPDEPIPVQRGVSRRTFLLLAAGGLVAGTGAAAGAAWWFWPPSADREEEYIPPGFRKGAGSSFSPVKIGSKTKKLYDHIVTEKDGETVSFRLVRHETPGDPDPFYMMETKVWNSLFAKFAATPEGRVALEGESEWQEGAWKNEGGKTVNLGVAEGRFPVMRVSLPQAHTFAVWLGGKLPTSQQWDKAAGCYVGKRGPFAGQKWDAGMGDVVAVNRADKGPMKVGEAKLDVSPWECRDMAGNGREWTRSSRDKEYPTVSERQDFDTRGRTYMEPGPVVFIGPKHYEEYFLGAEPGTAYSPEIGFRVVIELPKQ